MRDERADKSITCTNTSDLCNAMEAGLSVIVPAKTYSLTSVINYVLVSAFLSLTAAAIRPSISSLHHLRQAIRDVVGHQLPIKMMTRYLSISARNDVWVSALRSGLDALLHIIHRWDFFLMASKKAALNW